MNRFSVIYLLSEQYQHIHCKTHHEADSVLEHLFTLEKHTPIGIYDAKTELFYWESVRQNIYNRSSIEDQGKLGNQITKIAQDLRQQNELDQVEIVVVPQPVYISI
ncbi:hypothetical protein [Spirosoma pollinicola]|uniref:Uncharacterized protein n=1 Tax=Spirosoma pollinicola TaxID=2057025 RepID=A0A2K8YV57_9BACT|nr:hypothetical protein [Spirosoma pollinicola]AUD01520.1 hypothetical protein CWM47_06650 [Spirosoma pollinicola]